MEPTHRFCGGANVYLSCLGVLGVLAVKNYFPTRQMYHVPIGPQASIAAMIHSGCALRNRMTLLMQIAAHMQTVEITRVRVGIADGSSM